MSNITNKLFRHKPTGGLYIVRAEVEMQVNDKWIPAYLYQHIDLPDLYVRSQEDFKEKFESFEAKPL